MSFLKRNLFLIFTMALILILTAGCGGDSGVTSDPADNGNNGEEPVADDPGDGIEDPVGRELRVPADYESIQAAIDAASDGDTVIVSPGTYMETINFHGKNITVRSTDPANNSIVESTIIDGNSQGVVVTFENGETRDAVLAGFTITGGRGNEGGGILIASTHHHTSATIRNNLITENRATYGGGLYAQFSHALITGNTFTNNTVSNNGGAILAGFNTELEITGNVFDNNTAELLGGAIAVQGNALVTGNEFTNNSADLGGGAIIHQAGNPDIRDNIFSGNNPEDME